MYWHEQYEASDGMKTEDKRLDKLTFFRSLGFLIKKADLYLNDSLDFSYKYDFWRGAKTLLRKSSELSVTGTKKPNGGKKGKSVWAGRNAVIFHVEVA